MDNPNRTLLLTVGVLVVLTTSACATATREQALSVEERTALAGDELTPEERTLAGQVADRALRARQLITDTRRVYLVRVEWLRDKEAESRGVADRKALVTHYRYDDDAALVTVVDLAQRTAVQVDTLPHLPTPLATEEFTRARDLALAHPEVKAALTPYGERVTAEALVTRAASREDPIFGHRVVRMMFRVGPDYLTRPIVLVDLTTGQVTIERPASPR